MGFKKDPPDLGNRLGWPENQFLNPHFLSVVNTVQASGPLWASTCRKGFPGPPRQIQPRYKALGHLPQRTPLLCYSPKDFRAWSPCQSLHPEPTLIVVG